MSFKRAPDLHLLSNTNHRVSNKRFQSKSRLISQPWFCLLLFVSHVVMTQQGGRRPSWTHSHTHLFLLPRGELKNALARRVRVGTPLSKWNKGMILILKSLLGSWDPKTQLSQNFSNLGSLIFVFFLFPWGLSYSVLPQTTTRWHCYTFVCRGFIKPV